MRISIACAALLLGSVAYSALLAQGQIVWGNNLPAQPAPINSPQVRAPIYGVIPGRETTQLSGNTATGLPAGNQDYGAAPLLLGTGFTMAIFLGRNAAETRANLQFPSIGGSTLFRTSAAAAGLIFTQTATDPTWPAGTQEVNYQLRAWDNRGGTITSWAQVMASGVDHGESDVYVLPWELDGPSPITYQVRSFNLVQVPEPSLVALGVLALGGLLLRRRKQDFEQE